MNNEQVIKYIAENSNHVHATVIAEWLLTGYDVECNNEPDIFPGSWFKMSNPGGVNTSDYRLVRPKVKPAYRVYCYIGESGSNTQDRYEDGKLSPVGDETQIQWLTGWIEYDKWPSELVERISKIDMRAAAWLKDNWNSIDEEYCRNLPNYGRRNNRLDKLFIWEEAHTIANWMLISRELGEWQ